jgi:hypothetical protein
VTTTSTPQWDVDVDVAQVVGGGAADLQRAGGGAHRRLQAGAVVQVAAGQGAAVPQALDGALEDHLAAGGPGAGAKVDGVVGDRDRVRLVLHDQHGVALVAQPQQQLVHPLDVVGVQPGGGLVEDVGDVGERRAQVADHLGALRLAARQRARRPLQRQVAQPDRHKRVQGLPQRRQQRRHRRRVQPADPLGQVADLHRARVGDVDPGDLRRSGGLVESGAVAVGTGGEGDRPFHERADVRLQRVGILGQKRLVYLGDQPLIGEVDAVDLDLDRLLVEEVVQLGLGVVADRLVRVQEARRGEDPHGSTSCPACSRGW